MSLHGWLYRGGRPNRIAQALNRAWAWVSAAGVAPDYLVTAQIPGRRSGRAIRFPLVVAVVGRERYLVSMLGEQANWVSNARAAGGRITLLHGQREPVRLVEVPVEARPPILREYLRRAPGARPHVPIDKDAPLDEFARIAAQFPVFRVVADDGLQEAAQRGTPSNEQR